ncbi:MULTISPECIES: ATP-binding protein [Paracoccus]|uniref:histidine kinase n=1 Tax=Paracoccus aerius TaxID=1915382 RepID=A0ABS1S4J0_9RHOB|nr:MULTISPECIES: ATP-binding protein [Paracoccus]MBL3673632.1 sodium:solute symporter [Paracoccus aerius]QIR84434.1 sodium:solute symporter [Paracoccus sp. AK26]GHG22333.1 sodium:solute symporter [Paracoccus aerius]
MPFEALVAGCLAYVALMFGVAFAADRAASRGRVRWLDHPAVYTLSLSVYCSAWTFYGAVGYATRSGLEFATIYLGPTIVFCGAWWGLRRLVRVARMHHVTSIADLISARFGKSNRLAALITLIAVIAATPYVALQLQSVSLSFEVFATDSLTDIPLAGGGGTALWVAAGLALFTIVFGTRNLAADERHHGVVTAIALEAVVKLMAFLALGVFVVWGLAEGPADMLDRIAQAAAGHDGWLLKPDRWTALIVVSGAAIIALPRMFQVLVVEAADEDRLAVAGWAFPAYLFAMSLFVLPIAVMGQQLLPADANPDLYVLTLPAQSGQNWLAFLVFLGGFSAATSMVVVCTIALATMISNHWLVPLWLILRRKPQTGDPEDLRGFVLNARRLAILAVMAVGWVYYRATGGTAALASMGLVAFTGMAQVLPAMIGGLLWRGANRQGAYAGVGTGFALWLALIFLPSVGIGQDPALPPSVDPLAFAICLSLALNTLAFIVFSIFGMPDPVERLQGLSFVSAVDPVRHGRMARGADQVEPLLVMARRVWGAEDALRFFQSEAAAQGKSGYLPDMTPRFLTRLERRLAGSIGAATAHAMIDSVAGGSELTVSDLMQVATEAQRAKEETQRLENARAELARTATQLREANDKLTALSIQKDAFLGQISHELRTPMTSVRAFSEILRSPDLSDADRDRFAKIIYDESGRLTRLLDDLLDLSVLESGQAQLSITPANLHDLIERALSAASATQPQRVFRLDREPLAEYVGVITDADRLLQVLINVISNARKYCDAEPPVLSIRVRRTLRGGAQIDIADNGSGIETARQALIFEKFSRLNDPARAGGAGLGLAICKEIMANLGGEITYLPGQGGAAFRIVLPRRPPVPADAGLRRA